MSKELFSLAEGTHGKGVAHFCWQKSQGNYIATTGSDCVVRIWDRHGQKVDEIRLPGVCSGIGWDKDGDILAVANDQTSTVFLWNANNQRLNQIDSGLKDQMSCLLWSKSTALLALGSAKGTLLLYSHHSQKKLPIIGKHNRRIVLGAWSNQNLLALASEDRVLTVSNADGDTVHQTQLRGDPADIQFAELKLDVPRGQGDNCITMIVGKKTLYFFKLSDPQNPLELAFQPHYGSLVAYKWFGDGYVVMGFNLGYFVVISTHPKEIGQELFQTKAHHDNLVSVGVSQSVNLCATAGDNCVKIHSLLDLRDTVSVITLEEETHGLDKVGWSDDGQLLAIASSRGSIHVFLARLPMLHAAWQTRVAYLTSLKEVTVEDQVIKSHVPLTADVDLEPAFVGLGPYHVAIGMNNIAYFYLLTDNGLEKRRPYEYLGTVHEIKLSSDYAAALLDGRIQLHSIEQMVAAKPAAGKGGATKPKGGEQSAAVANSGEESRESRLFPDKQHRDSRITCFDMTADFIVYGTDRGAIHYFMLEAWTMVSKWHHVVGINKLFVNHGTGMVVFIDEKGDGFLYNPLNDRLLELPQFSPKTRAILWETSASNYQVFVAFDDELIHTYVYHNESIRGPHCQIAGRTKLPHGFVPILLYNGDITLQVQNGKVRTTRLGTHLKDDEFKENDPAKLLKSFEKAISLLRFNEAWIMCERMNIRDHWVTLGRVAMEEMEVAFAVRVFRRLGDAGMVWSLEELLSIDDRSLKSGFLAMYLEQFDLAQQLFLSSSKPVAALEMQRDLLNWEQALQLARALAPDQLPFISREYAQQLEFVGDFANALSHYEKGVTKDPAFRDHDEVCAAGIARTSIRTGDMRRGIALAAKLPNRMVKKDCAAILESLKQWNEAGQLYEAAAFHDEAAAAYIRAKNWSKVRELLDFVTSTKIYKDYAKAKEAEEQYKEAAKAYEKAKEWAKAVQLNLEKLQNPQEAVRLVQESGSVDGALLVARFFQKLNDYPSAIQFLVMSHCNDEGFKLAQQQHQMDVYAAVIADHGTTADYQSIAVYYETDRNYLMAGKFFRQAQQYDKAVKHLLRAHDIGGASAGPMANSEDALQLAIEAAGEANDQQLTKLLTDYLMGETDGMPKDPKYLFQLYMALKQYPEAAKSAVIIAREEQKAGNYRVAHDVLVSMCRELRRQKNRVPLEMSTSLQVLHSYLLARIYTKMNDHMRAARLLKRVATNYISRFPAHVVQILTSAVIECQRAGLKESAFSLAATLLRPEYRDQIDAKYKKKIEGIVRKPEQGEEPEPETSCPNCGLPVPEMELVCQHCKNALPYCIASGRHVTKEDFSVCPNCDFPCLLTDFLKVVAESDNKACPMCSEAVNTSGLRVIDDEVTKYLTDIQLDNSSQNS